MFKRKRPPITFVLVGDEYTIGDSIQCGKLALCTRVPHRTMPLTELAARAFVDEIQGYFHFVKWLDLSIGDAMLTNIDTHGKTFSVIRRYGKDKYSLCAYLMPKPASKLSRISDFVKKLRGQHD
jgi:hypothetical protein